MSWPKFKFFFNFVRGFRWLQLKVFEEDFLGLVVLLLLYLLVMALDLFAIKFTVFTPKTSSFSVQWGCRIWIIQQGLKTENVLLESRKIICCGIIHLIKMNDSPQKKSPNIHWCAPFIVQDVETNSTCHVNIWVIAAGLKIQLGHHKYGGVT